MVDIAKLAERGIEVTTRPLEGRGCGERKEGEPYGCSGASPYGKPIEEFIVDPVRGPITWQRGVAPLQRKSGTYDVVCFIGKKFWPSPWDKVEEVRHYGESRRFPKNFPFHLLTPGKSRMLLVHARAIPLFNYALDRQVPLDGCKFFQDDEDMWEHVIPGYHPSAETPLYPSCCTFGLQDLALFPHFKDALMGEGSTFIVKRPSLVYSGTKPISPNWASTEFKPDNLPWAGGLFLSLPLTHFEFYRHDGDGEAEKKITDAGFESVVLDY